METLTDIDGLTKTIQFEMGEAIDKIKNSAPTIMLKFFRKLRSDLLDHIHELEMNDERKSYFIHQLSYVHDMDELSELIFLMNEKQLKEATLDNDLDLIVINQTPQGINWIRRPALSCGQQQQ